jgi:hypothetical protein
MKGINIEKPARYAVRGICPKRGPDWYDVVDETSTGGGFGSPVHMSREQLEALSAEGGEGTVYAIRQTGRGRWCEAEGVDWRDWQGIPACTLV